MELKLFFIALTLVTTHIIAWKYGYRAGFDRGVELTKFNRDTFTID